LLASLANCVSLDGPCGQRAGLVSNNRISRFAPDDVSPYAAIRADVTRLTDELAREFELVCGQ
jgi:hypothetical protein